MKLLGSLFLLFFHTMVLGHEVPKDLSQKNKPQTIKVLLTEESSSLLLEVRGRYQVVNPVTSLEISSELMNKRKPLIATPNGIHWGELLPGIYHVRLVPQNAKTSILVDGIQYRGCIEVYQIKDTLQVINEVDVESYLKSILTRQFPEKMNEEVLQAIAVVARTNAYYLAKKNTETDWHVKAKESGYDGYALTLQNLKIDQAVDKTGQVILTYREAPFAATWTKDSAGKTAPFSSIFRKSIPSPQGVKVPITAVQREARSWNFTLPLAKLAELVQLPKISEIQPFRDKASDKVYALRLKDGEAHKDLDFLALQKQLGSDRLRSNDFTLKIKEDQAIFTGFGEGHGVGLCLYSALQLAKEGNSAKKILQAFFPETEFQIE